MRPCFKNTMVSWRSGNDNRELPSYVLPAERYPLRA
jgi:hypothetical protein